MDIYILNSKFEQIGVIDEYESVIWNKKYNDIGDCEIYAPCESGYIDLLQVGNYVRRYDDDMVCKITSIEIETDIENGDYIIATGTDIVDMLSDRIVRVQTSFSGKVTTFISKLIESNIIQPKDENGNAIASRQIANFTLDMSSVSNVTDAMEATVYTENLLSLIQTACKSCNLGFRLTYNFSNGNYVFRLYRGKDKASQAADNYVEFSPQYANITSSTYKIDTTNDKNLVYVGYKSANKEDDKIYLLSLFNGTTEPQGENRREIYVDASNQSREITYEELAEIFPNMKNYTAASGTNGYYYITDEGGKTVVVATYTYETTDGVKQQKITVTDHTYLILVRATGYNALASYKSTQEFSGEIDTVNTFEYKTDYDIGDTVQVVNEYGIGAAARITAIQESDDNEDGYVVEPTFEYII